MMMERWQVEIWTIANSQAERRSLVLGAESVTELLNLVREHLTQGNFVEFGLGTTNAKDLFGSRHFNRRFISAPTVLTYDYDLVFTDPEELAKDVDAWYTLAQGRQIGHHYATLNEAIDSFLQMLPFEKGVNYTDSLVVSGNLQMHLVKNIQTVKDASLSTDMLGRGWVLLGITFTGEDRIPEYILGHTDKDAY
jgi:hypothetical protein